MTEKEIQILAENYFGKSKADYPKIIVHVDDDFTLLIKSDNATTIENTWILPIGKQISAERNVKGTTIDDGTIEMLINDIEEAVVPLSREIEKGHYQLISHDKIVLDLLDYSWEANKEEKHISTTELERVFNRLAAVLLGGRPVSSDVLPTSADFVIELLILREVVHHLGFESLIYE